MMKTLILTTLLVLSFSIANAQLFNYGFKGGLNYNSNGDLKSDFNTIGSNEETGYHIGLVTEIKLPLWIYIRPELNYTHTESSYNTEVGKSTLKKDYIEMPVLVGFRVLGIGRIFLGPTFQYAVNTDLKNSSIDNISKVSSDDFTTAAQIGLGLEIGRLGGDIRWEYGLTSAESIFTYGGNTPTVDTSQQQFIFSIYYKFKKK